MYMYQSRRGPQYREIKYNPSLNSTEYKPEHAKIKVDNEGVVSQSYAVVIDDLRSLYEIEELLVAGKAHVSFYHPISAANLSIYAKEITGDKTGVVRVGNRQSLFVFIVQSTHTYMDAPCGFYVSEFGEMVLPTEVILRGEQVVLKGRMRGVETLVVERDGNLIVQGTAHTTDIGDEANWFVAHPFYPFTAGLFKIPKLSVNNRGTFKLEMNPVVPVLNVGELSIKKGNISPFIIMPFILKMLAL